MTLTAIRVPEWVHAQAINVLRRYRQRRVVPCRIQCGNLSLRVNRRWPLLSRNGGQNWKVLSHESYNKLKDRK